MVLNWTLEVISTFVATGVFAVSTGVLAYRYLIKHERHVLIFLIAWVGLTLNQLLEGLSYLYLSLPFFALNGLSAIPVFYAIILGADAITRETVDPIKVAVVTGAVVALFFLAMQPGSVENWTFPNGDKSLAMGGLIQYVYPAIEMLVLFVPWYHAIAIHRQAPPSMKRYSATYLIAWTIILWGVCVVTLTRLSLIIPGIQALMIAFAILLVSVVFVRQPKLAFILPFKVMRLTVIDTDSGISIFSHTWRSGAGIIDENMFSGMLQGVSDFIKESINRGNVDEIKLTEGVLILQRNQQTSAACVLVATKSSRTLRDALRRFSNRFCEQFKSCLPNTSEVGQFAPASSLVAECFPFLPEYD